MNEETHRRGRRNAPWGLLGMLALVWIGEQKFARRERYDTNLTALAWKHSGLAAGNRAPRCEVLCFGDSVVKYGVLPRVLEDRLGKKAYNLAVCCGPPAAHYFLLRRALEAGANPSTLLVDFLPFHLYNGSNGPRYCTRSWPELMSPPDYLDMAARTRDAELLASILVGRLLPSAKTRYELRNQIRAALQGRAGASDVGTQVLLRHLELNRGAMVGPARPHSPEDASEFAKLTYPQSYGDASPPDRATLDYIHAFLRLARDRKIMVFLLLPPMHPGIQARFEENGLDTLDTRFARDIIGRYPNLVVIDGRRAGYDHTGFCDDKIHLNRLGAFVFSSDVASLCHRSLADMASGPRWLELPRFRERPIDVALEDYDASRLALEASRTKHR